MVGLPLFLMFTLSITILSFDLKSGILEIKNKSVENSAVISAREFSNWVQSYRFYIDGLSKSLENLNEQQILDFLHSIKIDNEDIEGFLYIDKNQRVYLSNNALEFNKMSDAEYQDIVKNYATILAPPKKSPTTDKVITAVYHKLPNGDFLGLQLNLTALQKLVESISFGAGSYAFAVDGNGLFTAIKIKQLILKLNVRKGDSIGYKGMDILAEEYYKNPRSLNGRLLNPQGETLNTFFTPIPKTNGWTIGINVPDKFYNAESTALLIEFITFMVVLFIISAIVFSIALKRAFKPIHQMIDIFKSLTSEDGTRGYADLNQQVRINSTDEIGQLAKLFNTFIQTVAEIIIQISGTYRNLQASIATSNTNIRNILGFVDEQINEVNLVAAGMNQLNATVQDIAHHSQSAADAASLGKQETYNGSKTILDVVNVINQQATTIAQTAHDIEELNNSSSQIGEVMDVINAIAEQTNLLALNAAIEAARAGDAGRGFAVVADEVRALAARTHESTQQISLTVAELRNRISSSVDAMQEANKQSSESVAKVEIAGKAINTITNSIESIEDLNLQIATATEEQTQNANELNQNLSRVLNFSDSVASKIKEISTSQDSVKQIADKLEELILKFKF